MNIPQLPFWQECLRLLYWVFFKPVTIRRYVNSLEPDLPGDYSLWQARHRLAENVRLRRLLWEALALTFVLPWLTAVVTAWTTRGEIGWLNLSLLVGFIVVFSVSVGVLFALTFGIAFGIAANAAMGVVSSMAFSTVQGFAVGIAVGISFVVAVGVAVGAALGVGGGITFGIVGGLVGGVAGGIVSSYTGGVMLGVVVGVAIGIAYIVAYLRLPLYVCEWPWLLILWLTARFNPPWTITCVRLSPPHWDEGIWFPLWGIDDLVRQAARIDLQAGLAEIALLADSLGQKGLARLALANVTADVLAGYDSPAQLAAAPAEIGWLPEDLKTVRPDMAEILPALFAISQDLALTGRADNPLGRRLGLRDALERLGRLQERLKYLGREARDRWEPVLSRWHAVVMRELDALRTGLDAGGVENPYEVGNPLAQSRRALFKGRTDLRDAVAGALRERGRVTLVLTGPRRMGKTSFLLQLPALLPGKTIPVFVDLQRPSATAGDGAFLYEIARAIVRDAQPYRLILPAPARENFSASPFEAFDAWLEEQAIPRLQDFGLLLMLDEFERAGEALAAGRLSRQILDELRHTIQHRERVALLFAGVQTLDELGPEWSSYFINVRSLSIGYLLPAEAEDLIHNPDPTVDFKLEYTDEAVARILADTRCHPYLVQLVCSCIVEEANRRRVRRADVELVDAAEALALERGEPYFRNVWDEAAGADGRPLLRRIAAAGRPLSFPNAALAELRALDRMVRYRIIVRETDGYVVELPLVRRWVIERAPAGE